MSKIGWKRELLLSESTTLYLEVRYKEHLPPVIPSPAVHAQKLSDQLASFASNPRFSDVTLCTTLDGKQVPAHRVVLSMRSPVFAAMFTHEQMEESKNKRVDILDVSGEVLEAFLAYLYSCDVGGVTKFSTELLQLADKVCCC